MILPHTPNRGFAGTGTSQSEPDNLRALRLILLILEPILFFFWGGNKALRAPHLHV